MYNEDFKYYPDFHYVDWVDIASWDFLELNCTDKKYINTYFGQPRFFEMVEFMENAEEIMAKLQDMYEINIVSMGTKANLIGKRYWLENHLYKIDVTFIPCDLECFNDKSHVDMSNGIFIDDEYRYLITSNAGSKICFGDTYKWNERWGGVRCYNWYDIGRQLRVV